MTDDAHNLTNEEWAGVMELLAETLGKSSAALAVQSATVAMLIKKGVLTIEDAATISGYASLATKSFEFPPPIQQVADAALSGFAQSLTSLLSKN